MTNYVRKRKSNLTNKLWKHSSETLRHNKFIRYLWLIVVLIHSCHHRPKLSSFSLKKTKFRSIDLTCWQSTPPLLLRILKTLNTSSLQTTTPRINVSWITNGVFSILHVDFGQQFIIFLHFLVGKTITALRPALDRWQNAQNYLPFAKYRLTSQCM